MALQDLTPQLRTRLGRLERVVGLFVTLAALLMLGGLAFYIYQTAQRKGWFKLKLPYYTFVGSAAGLKVGQPVKLMGLDVGEITEIVPQEPGAYHNMYVAFRVKEPFYGYLWEDSRVKVASSDFLGNRVLELIKGTNGPATYIFDAIQEFTLDTAAQLSSTNTLFFVDEIYDGTKTNLIAKPNTRFDLKTLDEIVRAATVTSIRLTDKRQAKQPTGLWDFETARYISPNENEKTRKGFFIVPDEAPALNERLEVVAVQLEKIAGMVGTALPNVLDLTNQVQSLLTTANSTAANADQLLASARPIVKNLTLISGNLTDPRGSLGDWLIPTNLSLQLTQTLTSANGILTNSDARLTTVALDLDLTLANLANITSNLHAQVNVNTNLVSDLSRLIITTDDLLQGLKRHWLLRSAFKDKTPKTPSSRTPAKTDARSPKDGGRN